jgi:hypothetical protein
MTDRRQRGLFDDDDPPGDDTPGDADLFDHATLARPPAEDGADLPRMPAEGFPNGKSTSRDAKERAERTGALSEAEAVVTTLLLGAGYEGLTCREMEHRTGRLHQTLSSRIRDLKNPTYKDGPHVQITGRQRPATPGHWSDVVVHIRFASPPGTPIRLRPGERYKPEIDPNHPRNRRRRRP